ncbi:MAG: hypothetical protein R3E08_09355 [Thiotrichaceae bacterium]
MFVTFVIDFNRTAIAIESLGKQQYIEQSAEGIIVGAIDAGIMLTALQAAAQDRWDTRHDYRLGQFERIPRPDD